MNDFEAVVVDYIAADRSLFVNPQCLIQLNPGSNPDTSGRHWYCDALAVDFRSQQIFLCEFSFADSLGALVKRLNGWSQCWPELEAALRRDSHLPDWPIRPWLFVPSKCVVRLVAKVGSMTGLPVPIITTLEMTLPWEYCTWDRGAEKSKPDTIPLAMQS